MAVWEKTIRNVQKGYERLTVFAAVFSERVRAEVNIIRLRTQIDGVRRAIGEQHRAVGEKLLSRRGEGTLPATLELFFTTDEVAAALKRIAELEKELENLQDELQAEAVSLKRVARKEREPSA
jgi:hypothetical protein